MAMFVVVSLVIVFFMSFAALAGFITVSAAHSTKENWKNTTSFGRRIALILGTVIVCVAVGRFAVDGNIVEAVMAPFSVLVWTGTVMQIIAWRARRKVI